MGEAGEQTAPLGRAVIGGLIASTFAALYILPLAFAWIQSKSSYQSPSLLPKLKYVEAEKSTVTGLGQMQNYLEVRAPFNGIITERNIHPGALAGPNTKTGDKPMLSLEQPDHLRLVVNIPETVVPSITKNDRVEFKLNAYPDKIFHAVVSRRAGVINEAVRSEAIEFDVPSQGGEIKPGMYAEVKIPLNSSNNSYVVPTSAIVHSSKGVYVIAVNGEQKTKFITVQEGMNAKDSTEVFGDLEPASAVLKHPSTEIEEGTDIQK